MAWESPNDNALAERFPTPPGSTWSDLTIRFVDGHTIHARIGDASKQLNYTQMRMVDGRDSSPNEQWALLRTLAESLGRLPRERSIRNSRRQKQVQLLRQHLQKFFGISGAPLPFVRSHGNWVARFIILPQESREGKMPASVTAALEHESDIAELIKNEPESYKD